MTDPTEAKHPSTASEAEIAAMRAADPAAFDADEPDAGEGAAAAATPDAAAAAAAGDGGKDAAAAAGKEDGGGDGTMIPKARFDEVNNRAKDLERRMAELEAANASAAVASEARDFGAEIAAARTEYKTQVEALRTQYADGDLDLEDFDRKKDELADARDDKVRELTKAEATAESLAAVDRRESQKQEKQALNDWNTQVNTWKESNAEFLDNKVRRDAVSALMEEYGKDPKLSNDDLLAKVEKEAFEAFNWNKTGAPATNASPHAARNRADAAAAAAAAGAPGNIAGGVGNRGTDAGAVDLEKVKPGNFSKLSKADQEKMLGEGALD